MEFKLRPWELSDTDSLCKHANNWNIAKNMTDLFPHPYTQEAAEQFIAKANSFEPARFFAIVVQGQAIGGIGVHPQTDIQHMNAELGYWLSEAYWGKGIIPKAIIEMCRYAFSNFEINRIFARPFGSNTASQRVLEKCGFSLEAHFKNTLIKNNECCDELIYAIRKENF